MPVILYNTILLLQYFCQSTWRVIKRYLPLRMGIVGECVGETGFKQVQGNL